MQHPFRQHPAGFTPRPPAYTLTVWADSVQRIDELQRKYIAEVEQSYQIYDEIQAAIEALPDIRQTIAVHYHYLQDMKIDFICVKLDLSKSTVAKLLSTALDALEVPDATASMPDGGNTLDFHFCRGLARASSAFVCTKSAVSNLLGEHPKPL